MSQATPTVPNAAAPNHDGKLLFKKLMYLENIEREVMQCRAIIGLAVVRARWGVGRRGSITDANEESVINVNVRNGQNVKSLVEVLGVSRPTIYRTLDKQFR